MFFCRLYSLVGAVSSVGQGRRHEKKSIAGPAQFGEFSAGREDEETGESHLEIVGPV